MVLICKQAFGHLEDHFERIDSSISFEQCLQSLTSSTCEHTAYESTNSHTYATDFIESSPLKPIIGNPDSSDIRQSAVAVTGVTSATKQRPPTGCTALTQVQTQITKP